MTQAFNVLPEFATLSVCARPSQRLREYRKSLAPPVKSLSSSPIIAQSVKTAFPNAIVLNAETKDRAAQVALFQTSPEHRLFITSPRIGGLGITLTAASVMLQGEDRVHRLGQTRHVTVEYLYANKTVDNFILALINRKQQIFDQACDDLADADYLLRLSKKGTR